MFATLLIVTTSIVPHHHCDDGGICLIMDISNDKESEHNHGNNNCEDNCAMNIDLMPEASQIGHASKSGFIPQLIAIVSVYCSALPKPIEQPATSSFVYIIHAYHDIIGSSCGLRAPPMAA